MSQIEPRSYPPSVPVPAATLGYLPPVHYQRPGIISAIGIVGIVVACLSLLASFGTGMNAYGFYMISRMSMRMSRSVPTSVAPAPPAASTALPVAEAGVAMNTLSPMLKLDTAHERELDRMLRLHGREFLSGDDDTPLTGATIREDVTSSRPMTDSDSTPARLVTVMGTVEVYTDHAVFTSADGSTTVRTSARDRTDSTSQSPGANGGTATTYSYNVHANSVSMSPASASTTLTPAQVSSVVSSVNSVATSPLNAAQLQTLRAELAKPNQSLVTVGSAAPVMYATVQPGANATTNVTIMFDTGSMLVLGPVGQVVSSGPPPMPKFNVSGWSVAAVVLDALASAALAVLLIVASIVVLRGSFLAPRLMRIYAWAKIPLALLGGAALAWMGYEFYMGMSGMPGMAAQATTAGAYGYFIVGLTMAAIGMAFPIGVLIAMRSRTVNSYFNSVVA